MSRDSLPFHSDDISALARSLRGQLADCEHQPSHVELLNMLARSNGYRNFQHFRAQLAARDRLDSQQPVTEPESVDFVRIRRLLRIFDPDGRLMRWPSKRSQQELCLWVLWSKLPARQVFSATEINQRINASHLFGDHALLRRWLCDYGMVSRTRDGREYRRVERRPPPEALELIRHLRSVVN
ncbi:MAG: DUF2087 domain-containing protein [Salinivirgaceae bacterium]|nr:DUF2087 domain-containing protein [Salinivirgaceae bacterium]